MLLIIQFKQAFNFDFILINLKDKVQSSCFLEQENKLFHKIFYLPLNLIKSFNYKF